MIDSASARQDQRFCSADVGPNILICARVAISSLHSDSESAHCIINARDGHDRQMRVTLEHIDDRRVSVPDALELARSLVPAEEATVVGARDDVLVAHRKVDVFHLYTIVV